MLKDLTYKVIVIDDEEETYEDYIEIIERKLDSEGYILRHERYEELSELDDNPLDDVDLFLVDLNFGSVEKGPSFIRRIRKNFLTDILFYSSDAKRIRDIRMSGEFQGVFFAVRDENKNEIREWINHLIDKMIKRSNTPISTRGIILGSVAELDSVIKNKASNICEMINPEKRKALLDRCTKIIYDSYRGQSKHISDFLGCEFHKGMRDWGEVKEDCGTYEILDLVTNLRITDSNKNCRILSNVYQTAYGKDETYRLINTVLDLLNDRNILAHVTAEINEDGEYQFKRMNGDGYLTLSAEKCRQLRNSIIEHYKAINGI